MTDNRIEKWRNISLTDLEVIILNAIKTAKEMKVDTKVSVIQKIMELSETIGVVCILTEANVKPSKRGLKVEKKYRDPKNYNLTWSGRGCFPVWLRDKINNGHDLTEFLV